MLSVPWFTVRCLLTKDGCKQCEKFNPSTGKPCNTIFSRPHELARHEESIHVRLRRLRDKIHCSLCVEETTFDRNDALKRHMRVAHPEHKDIPKRRRRREVIYIKSPKREKRDHIVVLRPNERFVPTEKFVPSRRPLHRRRVVLLQPDPQSNSQEQLTAEIESIYTRLMKAEAKCIEVDNQQMALAQPHPEIETQRNNEEWQALTTLYLELLHEYRCFFLASRPPIVSLARQPFPHRHSMRLRLRRHGLLSFLELLKQGLPASREHMITFTCESYKMMNRLYETIPRGEYTWINCLADIARYRSFIEDDHARDGSTWEDLANYWSSKAAAKSRQLYGVPLPNLTQFPDEVHRTVAGFLDHKNLIKLSLTCTTLRAAYRPALAESLRVSLFHPLYIRVSLESSQRCGWSKEFGESRLSELG